MEKTNMLKKIRNEYLGRGYSTLCGLLIIGLTLAIIFFVASKGLNLFLKDKYSLLDFLFFANRKPDRALEKGGPQFGTLIFIAGSVFVSVGAVILSAPVGVSLAIFTNHMSPKLGIKVLQPAMELFVGISSVVYGWVGITVLVPFIKRSFGGLGFSLLAGIMVLSIIIPPTITSIASEAIRTIPRDYIP